MQALIHPTNLFLTRVPHLVGRNFERLPNEQQTLRRQPVLFSSR
jgi:hypothetical protein